MGNGCSSELSREKPVEIAPEKESRKNKRCKKFWITRSLDQKPTRSSTLPRRADRTLEAAQTAPSSDSLVPPLAGRPTHPKLLVDRLPRETACTSATKAITHEVQVAARRPAIGDSTYAAVSGLEKAKFSRRRSARGIVHRAPQLQHQAIQIAENGRLRTAQTLGKQASKIYVTHFPDETRSEEVPESQDKLDEDVVKALEEVRNEIEIMNESVVGVELDSEKGLESVGSEKTADFQKVIQDVEVRKKSLIEMLEQFETTENLEGNKYCRETEVPETSEEEEERKGKVQV
ncbi:polypeptide of 976 aa [Culex quinquefasciatus]|uniref:Polypeptide of 976 aa n=1 Tax=Culex quinquefasciatus TaxID=7176 RepID=B0XGI6_CULQU|nr:polypeptide of 976 aa [Culex quinquefasciatus]|eukprot:XP_001868758.1 polypeptide of 976 aa [Culex quinquefasciatus]